MAAKKESKGINWEAILRQWGQSGAPFNETDYMYWVMDLIGRGSDRCPPLMLKKFLWEAITIPFEDCDTVPHYLRTFDAALKQYLIEETAADMRALLESMDRASQIDTRGAELTGKQALRYMVGSFFKSPDAQAVAAYDALGKFKVHDPSNPV